MPATAPPNRLRLHDSATGAIEVLEPRDPGRVSMYVCGPTVYGPPHLGHGRFSLVFDILRRYLEFCGFEVDYVSNITDIDDKIIERARTEGRTEQEVAAQFEAVWWQAMDALGVRRPTSVPHATQWVGQMVELIDLLVASGKAYETASGVYLAVDQVEGYGLLALQPLDKLRVGARVESDEDKRSPMDFALWKKAKPGEPTWPSPWGPGRPGWHTECVVMSLGLLGEGFDLHGGGQDLRFPHHENERAQAVALGRRFARHWVHNGFVEVEGEKMSKSLGNFTTLTDLLSRSDPRALRLLVCQSHYRSPIEVTPLTIGAAERSLMGLDALARRLGLEPSLSSVLASGAARAGADPAEVEAFCAAMDDDLQTPTAMSRIFELISAANVAADEGRAQDARRLGVTVAVLAGALGIEPRRGEEELDEKTAALVAERDEARARRDWARSDEIRDALRRAGWVVEDTAGGTRLHRAQP